MDFRLIPGINDYYETTNKEEDKSRLRLSDEAEEKKAPTFSRQLNSRLVSDSESSISIEDDVDSVLKANNNNNNMDEVTTASTTTTTRGRKRSKSKLIKKISQQLIDSKKSSSSSNNNERDEEKKEDSDRYDNKQNGANDYKRICIVTNWAQFRTGKAHFKFEYINLHLCTHIIFSSATINEIDAGETYEYAIKSVQQNDFGECIYSRFNLIQHNSILKNLF